MNHRWVDAEDGTRMCGLCFKSETWLAANNYYECEGSPKLTVPPVADKIISEKMCHLMDDIRGRRNNLAALLANQKVAQEKVNKIQTDLTVAMTSLRGVDSAVDKISEELTRMKLELTRLLVADATEPMQAELMTEEILRSA